MDCIVTCWKVGAIHFQNSKGIQHFPMTFRIVLVGAVITLGKTAMPHMGPLDIDGEDSSNYRHKIQIKLTRLLYIFDITI